MMRWYFLHVLLLSLLTSTVAVGQDTNYLRKPALTIPRLEGEIILDGISNEDVWQKIPSVPFIVYEPVWGAKPSERTELRFLHDDNFLYISGKCFTKDSSTIIGRTLVRDGYRGDDWMTVHIDSRFDKQNAFVFSVYPLGSRYDMTTSNDAIELGNSTFNSAYNMIWDAKVVMTKEGWFYEMKIPFYNLRFKKNPGGSIEMALSSSRFIQYNQELHQFPAIQRNVVEGIMKPSIKQPILLGNVSQPKLLLITPYVTAANERYHEVNTDKTKFNQYKKNNLEVGLDAKIGVSPYLTLDASINPDFAQVEADDQQVNLSRFSLFFPERRLFFQEQLGLFELNLGGASQLFYSRRIGINESMLTPIYGGLRLTGKLNAATDIGLLSMQSAPQKDGDSVVLPTENFSVLRLRKKVFNDRSFLGGMVTGRVGSGHQQYAFGFDAMVNLRKTQYLFVGLANSLKAGKSETTKLSLKQSRINLLLENRRLDRWFYKIGYIFSGNDFEPGIGFIDRSNYNNPWASLNYGKYAKERKGIFQYQQFTLARTDIYFNAMNGKLESWEHGIGWRGTTFKGLQLSAQFANNYEYVADSLDFGNNILIRKGRYNAPSLWLFFTPAINKKVRVPLTLSEGKFFDGRRFFFSITPTFNLGKHWEINTGYNFTRLRFPYKNQFANIHIARLKLNYAMDLHFSASANLQYNSSQNQLYLNGRLRYNFKDGHDIYFVINNTMNTETYYSELVKKPVNDRIAFLFKYYYTFQPLRK